MFNRVPAWLILLLAPLFWAGNFIAGRMVGDQNIAITLSFWRWALALLFMLPFVAKPMWQQRQVILRHLPALSILGVLSVSTFNTLLYIGMQTTTATTGSLMNSLIPLYVLIISILFLGHKPSQRQLLGLLLSFAGVLAIISRLDSQTLANLEFTQGDLWLLMATFTWGVYSVLLKPLRPVDMTGLSFLGSTAFLGTLALLPLYWLNPLGEVMPAPDQQLIGVLIYTSIFPSILAYLAWNHGLAVMGANVGSQFVHFSPVFGAALAALILGERLHSYHWAGAALIGAGLYLSLRSPSR